MAVGGTAGRRRRGSPPETARRRDGGEGARRSGAAGSSRPGTRPLAPQALTAETGIGLLLPCNVVVYQGDSPDETVVSVLDPEVQLAVTGRDDIAPLAREVRARMERVLDAL